MHKAARKVITIVLISSWVHIFLIWNQICHFIPFKEVLAVTAYLSVASPRILKIVPCRAVSLNKLIKRSIVQRKMSIQCMVCSAKTRKTAYFAWYYYTSTYTQLEIKIQCVSTPCIRHLYTLNISRTLRYTDYLRIRAQGNTFCQNYAPYE